jgi:hypothetical protein
MSGAWLIRRWNDPRWLWARFHFASVPVWTLTFGASTHYIVGFATYLGMRRSSPHRHWSTLLRRSQAPARATIADDQIRAAASYRADESDFRTQAYGAQTEGFFETPLAL